MAVKVIGKSEHLLKNYPVHKHELWEIIYNVYGCGKIDIGNKTFEFTPDSITVIPPSTDHYKYSDDYYSDIYVQITDLPFKEAFCVNDDSDKNFFELIDMSYRIFHKQNNNYKDIVNSLWNAMLRILLNLKNEPAANVQIESFKNTLIDHISDPDFKIEQLINKTNYSKDHFRRLFKEETGTTPTAYLQALRINYAKLLLRNKNTSNFEIGDIAYMCGFYDQRYFGRIFKKIVGITPSEYSQIKEAEN